MLPLLATVQTCAASSSVVSHSRQTGGPTQVTELFISAETLQRPGALHAANKVFILLVLHVV